MYFGNTQEVYKIFHLMICIMVGSLLLPASPFNGDMDSTRKSPSVRSSQGPLDYEQLHHGARGYNRTVQWAWTVAADHLLEEASQDKLW